MNTLRRHKLLTKQILNRLEKFPLRSQENIELNEQIAIVKFFSPYSNFTWFVTEFDKNEGLFFGRVDGHESEWGYFTLDELENAIGRGGFPLIERDCYFSECKIKDAR